MLYLISTNKKTFGKILAKSMNLNTIKFHKNFMLKTGQIDEMETMICDVTYDRDAKYWGFQPWVASYDDPDPEDPWTQADTEQEAFQEFVDMIRGQYV